MEHLPVDPAEATIEQWRTYAAGHDGISPADVDELEGHLRDLHADLQASGLTADEAMLIAIARLGSMHEIAAAFAREDRGRLWKRLVVDEPFSSAVGDRRPSSAPVTAIWFAIAAGLTLQVPALVAGFPLEVPWWLLRNAPILLLVPLIAYFGAVRHLPTLRLAFIATPVAIMAVMINLYPLNMEASTAALAVAHLPVVMWCIVGAAYMDGTVRHAERRMDFVRFTGEWLIYLALVALGGGVLVGLTVAIFQLVGVAPEQAIRWILPAGVGGAVVIVAWLVESKQRVIENMAPVLTMVFTPLFAAMLVAAVAVYAATGLGGGFDRELLALFDVMLVVVLGLVLYSNSARDPLRAPNGNDRIQLVAVVSALILNTMVLGMMFSRVGEFGFTPNRVAALGLNLLLLVNLAGAAWHTARFVTGKATFLRVERWQTDYVPWLAAWAGFVVVVLPPLFAFS